MKELMQVLPVVLELLEELVLVEVLVLVLVLCNYYLLLLFFEPYLMLAHLNQISNHNVLSLVLDLVFLEVVLYDD
jgi:hypothetical protein